MTSEAGEPAARQRVQGDADRVSVVIGLLADPDLPAEIAYELAADLPELLSERIDDGTSWAVSTRRQALAAGTRAELCEAARERMREEGWDLAISLTDLPLGEGGRPVAVDANVEDGIGVVSLPALGPAQPRGRAREAIVGLVGHLVRSARDKPAHAGVAEAPESPAPAEARSGSEHAAGDVRFVASRARRNARLLADMVRADRPWRLLLGLSRVLSAAAATAAIALMNVTVWQVGDALGPLRLCLVTVGSVGAMVAWLIVAHGLWERSSTSALRDQVRLFNAATVLTLTLGVLCMYLVVFVVDVLVAEVFIDGDLLRSKLRHSIGLGDYLTLAWVVTAAATIGGALGSGLESTEAVRHAAYGRRDDRSEDE